MPRLYCPLTARIGDAEEELTRELGPLPNGLLLQQFRDDDAFIEKVGEWLKNSLKTTRKPEFLPSRSDACLLVFRWRSSDTKSDIYLVPRFLFGNKVMAWLKESVQGFCFKMSNQTAEIDPFFPPVWFRGESRRPLPTYEMPLVGGLGKVRDIEPTHGLFAIGPTTEGVLPCRHTGKQVGDLAKVWSNSRRQLVALQKHGIGHGAISDVWVDFSGSGGTGGSYPVRGFGLQDIYGAWRRQNFLTLNLGRLGIMSADPRYASGAVLDGCHPALADDLAALRRTVATVAARELRGKKLPQGHPVLLPVGNAADLLARDATPESEWMKPLAGQSGSRRLLRSFWWHRWVSRWRLITSVLVVAALAGVLLVLSMPKNGDAGAKAPPAEGSPSPPGSDGAASSPNGTAPAAPSAPERSAGEPPGRIEAPPKGENGQVAGRDAFVGGSPADSQKTVPAPPAPDGKKEEEKALAEVKPPGSPPTGKGLRGTQSDKNIIGGQEAVCNGTQYTMVGLNGSGNLRTCPSTQCDSAASVTEGTMCVECGRNRCSKNKQGQDYEEESPDQQGECKTGWSLWRLVQCGTDEPKATGFARSDTVVQMDSGKEGKVDGGGAGQ